LKSRSLFEDARFFQKEVAAARRLFSGMYTTCSKGIGRSAVTLRRGLLGALLAYLLTCTGIAMFQDHLLYYPSAPALAKWTAGGLAPWPTPMTSAACLPNRHVRRARRRSSSMAMPGMPATASSTVDALVPLGLRVILAEYPAYGPRTGDLGEASLVADAERTIALAHSRYGGPLLIIGESLGAGVAAAASARQRKRSVACC
jgi:hypothetical protein